MRRRFVVGGIAAAVMAAGTFAAAQLGGVATAQPDTADSAQDDAPAITPHRAPTKASVDIDGIYQSSEYLNVPTVGKISLSSFGINASTATLADQMHTNPDTGTLGIFAIPVLSDYVHDKGFKYVERTDVDDPSKLMRRVAWDVGVLKHAPILEVYLDKLPWYEGDRYRYGHNIVVTGYNKKYGTITVWDPESKSTGGEHTISAKKLAAATQTDISDGMYFISLL